MIPMRLPVITLASALLALAPSLAAAQADPPRDAAKPPGMEELTIPSGTTRMNGFIYLAQGAEPHPVVVFLHGYPGNERNLDLAQAVRRAGWHALYFDYRGSWGSGGTFGFQNALDDVEAALAWLRTPETRTRFRVDADRIAIVGHSVGGWLAMMHAADDPATRCIAPLDPANLGGTGKRARAEPSRDFGAYFRQTTHPEAGPIRARADDLLRELVRNADRWDYLDLAPALKGKSVLFIASTAEAEAGRQTLTRRLADAGATHVRSLHYDDDHPFSAHRLALAEELVTWLRGDCASVQGGGSARSGDQPHAYVPADGFVPDSASAIAIAEAVLTPIYGPRLESERPLRAALQGDTWSVSSTPPSGMLGGGVLVEISRRDGRILRVTHGR
jgi:pimeloyl-ACP methyl ester carboxylesterase